MMPFLLKLTLMTSLAAHGADLATTEHCLGAGKCHEMNPWLARFEQPAVFGAAKMGVAAIGTYGSERLAEHHPKWALMLNLAVTGSYAAIALHNTQVGR